ncbi:hypothetical protein [Psychromonas sp.]|uniref:hypothetical protein n=1 Tax=Psychromonas sp. TaxID=1884585 RepID=UPI0035674399
MYFRAAIGQRVLLITDQSDQKYADSVSQMLICCMNNQMPLESYTVPMSLVTYPVDKVYIHLNGSASIISSKISVSYYMAL